MDRREWNTVLWLRDLAPGFIPRAQFLTFGYESPTRGRQRLGNESIHDLGRDPMSSIAAERQISMVRVT